MYTYYRVRKLRTEERLAAIARGANVAMEPDLSEAAHSRRWGILLAAIALGYMAMMAMIARAEPDAWKAAAVGIVPLAAGLGFPPGFRFDPQRPEIGQPVRQTFVWPRCWVRSQNC